MSDHSPFHSTSCLESPTMVNGTWTVFIQHLSSLSDYSKCFTTQVSIHPFTHTFTHKEQVTSLQRANLLIRNSFTHIHSPVAQPL